MSHLRSEHPTLCRQWFEELEPVRLDSGLLEVHTTNAVQQNYLQKRCVDQFTSAAQAVTGNLVAVRFVTGPVDPKHLKPARQAEPAHAASTRNGSNNGATSDTRGSNHQSERQDRHAPSQVHEPNIEQIIAATGNSRSSSSIDDALLDSSLLSPDYSFDHFITGPNNRLAYAASVAVANQPGVAYNPLFIHGGVGLGKTHLLQAICQQILGEKPDTQIVYLSCDAFMNQFIECVQSGKMNEFRHRYRHADMLVIDDIHFLAQRERSQEEFFHTFNELYQSKRQIVLSSDSPPSEIPDLEERLVSRFQWGLVANVSKPDLETRVAIIKAKARLRGIDLPPEVTSHIATKIDTNARELEGALTTVQGYAALQDKQITIALAREALGEPASESRNSQVTLQHIIDTVTDYYSVKLSDLQSRRRHKSVTGPRQVCMWLARKQTRFSLEEIGGYFGGRDHTTVMHSIRTVDDRRSTDEQFSRQLDHLHERILADTA